MSEDPYPRTEYPFAMRVGGHVVHRRDCRYLTCPARYVTPLTKEQAARIIHRGPGSEDLRACRTCKPEGLPPPAPRRGRRTGTGWPS